MMEMVRSCRIQDIILKPDITGFGDRLNVSQEQKKWQGNFQGVWLEKPSQRWCYFTAWRPLGGGVDAFSLA